MKFSVVIPTYNREKILLRAINSVLNQTIQDFEIVVVDDGSTDNTSKTIHLINDERIHYICQKNQGATVARNTGIINSKGVYVSFLDSDDIWHPQMLEKQLEKYESDDQIGWVYTNVQGVSSNGKSKPFGLPLGIQGFIYSKALSQGYVAPTTVLSAKKEALVSVGMFDINLPASQDDDICFKLAKNYKVAFVSDIMASMLYDPDNRISSNSRKVALGWWMLWNKYENDVLHECGKDVLLKHYLKCVRRFAIIQDMDMTQKALDKYKYLGGSLSRFQYSFIIQSIKCNGLLKEISDRLLYKVI